MKERRKDVRPEAKLGWYYRYWKSMSLDREKTNTFTLEDWNSFIKNDPFYLKKSSKNMLVD